MAFNARVFRIFIASPSDVEEEREIITRVIQEWNDLYSYEKKTVLLPIRWETHSAPELGDRGQEFINRDLVDYADMAVGVFWTRIGTPTGKFPSGTIEEIKKLGDAGKLVMCYFSRKKPDPNFIDQKQLNRLEKFKIKTYRNGLIEHYSNSEDFKKKFTVQLQRQIIKIISKDVENNDHFFNIKTQLERHSSILRIEDIVKFESETIGDEVWIVTYDLSNDAFDGRFYDAVKSNIQRGVRYTYLISDRKENDECIRSITDNFAELNRIDLLHIKVIKETSFIDFIKKDVNIYNPNRNHRERESVFIQLPVQDGECWVLADRITGQEIRDKIKQIISTTNDFRPDNLYK